MFTTDEFGLGESNNSTHKESKRMKRKSPQGLHYNMFRIAIYVQKYVN